MRYNGEKIEALATGTVIVPRVGGPGVEFKVRALTYGEEREIEKLFPDPNPPWGDILKPNGLPELDDNNKKVQGYLFDDPGYQFHVARTEDLRVVMKLVRCLDKDPRIEWSSTEPRDKQKFYEDVLVEIQEAGFSFGDMALVLNKAIQLGNLDSKALERAAEAFSQREQAEQ